MNFQILECKHFVAPSAKTVIKRVTKDYEIDYFLKGDRVIYTNGEKKEIHAGDICFRYPGQEVYSFGDYDCYITTLDFSEKNATENYSRNLSGNIQPLSSEAVLKDIPSVFSPRRAELFQECFSDLIRQSDYHSKAAHLLMEEILYLIQADLAHKKYHNCKETWHPVDKIKQYLDENYQKDITLHELSKMIHMEKSYLIRIFRTKFGSSPIDYLIKLRLNRARDLLLNTNMTVSEIAFDCGYNNPSFFIAQYKKHYKTTPSQYRKNIF